MEVSAAGRSGHSVPSLIAPAGGCVYVGGGVFLRRELYFCDTPPPPPPPPAAAVASQAVSRRGTPPSGGSWRSVDVDALPAAGAAPANAVSPTASSLGRPLWPGPFPLTYLVVGAVQ